MIKTLTFGGISFSDYQCFYDGSELWKKPQRMVDTYSVPGRNGDLIVSQEKYSNVSRSLKCFITGNWKKNYNSLIDALSNYEGYARFESTEEPDVYMMASLTNEISPSMYQFNAKGEFTLTFDFKPQKWLKSGEMPIEITSSKTLLNPTSQTAYPLIEVEGTGTITINGIEMELDTNTSTTYIDCELQDAYEGTINRNTALTVDDGFPVLSSGENTIEIEGFTSCIIYPRWWRL